MDERNQELVKDDEGPWGSRNPDLRPARPQPAVAGYEPAFNVPWPVLVLIGLLGLSFLTQRILSPATLEYLVLTPVAVEHGQWHRLLSSLLMHVSFTHLLFNCASALAFAAPVARYFGTRPLGALVFFIFYGVCGLLAGLGFVAVHLHQDLPAVVASGAVAGLMGAASRLMQQPGVLSPIISRPVLALGGAWIAINTLMGMLAGTQTGVLVPWESQVFGFVAGALLIGLFGRLRPRPLPGS